MDNIKITMLGTTSSGKTSYMVSMYADMQLGRNGFTFSAKDMDMDLELSDYWEKLINKGEDRWPSPTVENDGRTKNYAFSFNYGMKPLIGFEWLDYRGGAMSDKEIKEDVQLLIKNIFSSSCLFLCVSGEYLKEKINPTTANVKLKANRINQWIQQVSNQLNPSIDKPYAVAIVITKYDLCKHRNKQEILDDVKQLFQGLFTHNTGWLVMICPVSLGKELAEDPENGEINPINVHFPVAFAIYSKFREYAVDKKIELKRGKKTISNLENNWLERLLKGAEIEDKGRRVRDLEKEIDEIESNLRLLSQELQNAHIYLGGKEVKLDV